MCRRLTYLACFVFALSLVLTGAAEAMDPDLAAYWRFDEGSGTTAFDSSGNGNDGTFVGDPQWVAGKYGGALEFNGDDYLNCGNGASLQIQDEITIAFWFQVNAFQNTWEAFLAKSDSAYRASRGGGDGNATHLGISGTSTGGGNGWFNGTVIVTDGQWHHFTGVYDGAEGRIYIDGVLDVTSPGTGQINLSASDLYIGENSGATGRFLHGLLDDVRIYSRALTDVEILGVMAGGGAEYPNASAPNPADGSLHPDVWVSLGWRPGDFAVSHDVYFGENFDDVNEGTGGTFYGNTENEYWIAGFIGYPYPDGLVPGTTYYWRIDEVNDANVDSPWKGNVWSFWLPPKKAYDPVPGDAAWFVETDVTLAWTPGYLASMHAVYFGDDFDTVNNATGAPALPFTTYTPGALEPDKTYYWRVDEWDQVTTHTGDVWMFKTAKEGGGVKGEYFHHDGATPHDPPAGAFRTLMLTRTDPQIDFNWGNGSPDASINVDDFSVIWTGEVQAVFTETYTFYTNTDDGIMLWIDGQLIIDNWTVHAPVENSGTIDLVSGQQYSLEMWWFERGGGAVAELRWSSPSTPKQLIPQGALSPPIKASGASPPNGATGVKMTPTLSWNAGDFAAEHQVYFGTDPDVVKNATTASLEYKGTRALGDESFEPGKLAWDSTYYWRVDEVNNLHPDSPWVGSVWSFRTGDFLVVDNMEDYDVDNAIWANWLDGLGYVDGDGVTHAGNGSGSEVGDPDTASYTEETIRHSGSQSMPYWYNNSGSTGKFNYSEATLTLTAPRDWTEEQVKALSLWFQGYPASVGSFVESPPGTYTMTGSGADIWDIGTAGDYHDEFHFAYKMLNGAGSIVARVESVENTNGWAKAGVMIRETLEGGSPHAFACVTPEQGVASQGRPTVGAASFNTAQGGITAPHWVRLERDMAGTFTVSHSTDGSSWEPVTGSTPQTIGMSSNVYVGLALTSHDAALTCEAVFSNVTTTGNVTGLWMSQDIGIQSNDPEPMYVAVANSTGAPAVVYHDNPDAVQIDTWTEWLIDLKEFQDKGVNLTNVDSIAIGFGNRNNPQVGGSGKMYFDDISLYRARFIPGMGTPVASDVSRNGVVDMADIGVLGAAWLSQAGDPGLWYEYCEGSWSLLPDFDIATTAKQGVINNFDITVRDQDDNFGFRFSGQINITTVGDYTFYTTSDDGSQLFIDGAMLVDNDGTHGMVEQSGTVSLSAGFHDIVVTMFELGGGEGLDVEWEGPGIAREAIPDDVLFLPPPAADLNSDGIANFEDYALVLDQWLEKQLWPEW